MQDYAQFSKFYLKRNWREKENVITFICSCISQKRQPHSRQSISGAEGHFCKEQKQKETFINKKRRIRRKTTFRTSKKEISGTSIDEPQKAKQIFRIQKEVLFKHRKTKRINCDSWKFRVRFILNQKLDLFECSEKSIWVHNHQPDAHLTTEVTFLYLLNNR